jgi:putative thioredoxin
MAEQILADGDGQRAAGIFRQVVEMAPDNAAALAGLVAMGEQVLAEGDGERAASIFRQIAEMAPGEAGVQSGLIRSLLAAGQTDEARAAFDALPEDVRKDPVVAQAGAALELAGSGVDETELDNLRKAAAERPTDHQAQFDFAQAAFAAGERDAAADTLLRLVETAPEWNDGAAKAKLLQIFEAVGLEDPWVAAQRRRLSLLLFG